MKLCVGLTGGIGSGKSTVSNLFAKHEAGIIDTDVIAHELTKAQGDAIPDIRKAFGSDYITSEGALDRNRVRGLIFSDVIAKLRLEHILHPLIFRKVHDQIVFLQNSPYIIIVVPLLLYSSTFQQLIQRILVVDCPEELQVKRVMERNQMNEKEVRNIIAQQTPRIERLNRADDIITNDSSIDSLSVQVKFLHKFYSNQSNSN